MGDENEEVNIQNKTKGELNIRSIVIKRISATEIRVGA